ncbi:hypothetical protein SO802_026428 [Lithocarpus litseifolius]|uniref:RNase H type-1 domain-containing protein n=1 Tax=Lithocarpus litseifolius TaxID=425828 RepID=A0AAW2C1R3_9ROSI
MKKMYCTPSGLARASHRFGMRTHSGIHSKAHTTRNKVRFSPLGFPIDQVMQRAITALMDFWTVTNRVHIVVDRPRVKWKVPWTEFYKINFDGAMFKEEDRAGIGVIIRDSQGLALALLSQVIPLPLTVVDLETLAAVKAFEFTFDLSLGQVILEGDSETVINSLNDNSPSLAPFGLLIQGINNYANLFQCISFLHVHREENNVAHNLARHACHVTGFSVWMEDVPSHIFATY